MLDIQFIREHTDIVKESQRKRGESVELVDEVLSSDTARREALKAFEEARAQQKEIGKKVASAPADEKAKLIAETKELSQKVSEYKSKADSAAEEYTTAMWKLSNIVEPEAPEGGEDDYVVVKKVGQIRDFAAEGFEPKDHLTLGTGVAGIDMRRGVKVGGSRFYFLRGQVARMQIAMLTMAVDQAEEHGFTLAITPTLVRPEVMRGTGFLNSHADEIYRLREPDDQYLVGTSEVALAGMHENEILDLGNGPLRYCGWSSCYRREAGAAGKDTSGIIRVHQFDKVEMFVYAKQEDSYKEHEHLLAMEQEMLAKVEVPYRIIDTAAGDLGSSAARKFDCEASGADPGPLPRAHLHLELHRVPGSPPEHPRAYGRRRHPPGLHPERHVGHHPLAGRHHGEPPAEGRLHRDPEGHARLHGRQGSYRAHEVGGLSLIVL